MTRYTPASIANDVGQLYLPEGFLRQYSRCEGLPVVLGEGVVEERHSNLFSVVYHLVIGGGVTGSVYSVDARGIYSNNLEILAVSFSGKHPLARGAPFVQLIARNTGGRLVRGEDLWLDIVFPGFELTSQEQQPRVQPQLQPQRRVAVVTAAPLSETVISDLEKLLQGF